MLAKVSENTIFLINNGLLVAFERLDFDRNCFVIRFIVDCF